MECFFVAEFLLTSASRGPSAIAEPLVTNSVLNDFWSSIN